MKIYKSYSIIALLLVGLNVHSIFGPMPNEDISAPVLGVVVGASGQATRRVLAYEPPYIVVDRYRFASDNNGVEHVHRSATTSLEYLRRLEADSSSLLEENRVSSATLARERAEVDRLRALDGNRPWKDVALGVTTAGTVVFGVLYLVERRKNG